MVQFVYSFIMGLSLGMLIPMVSPYFIHTTTTHKFQVNDCIDFQFPGNEFEKPHMADLEEQIIKVGKELYLTEKLYARRYSVITEMNTHYISQADDSYIKVDCPK